jgi:hypothetical protein
VSCWGARRPREQFPGVSRVYGGVWDGPIFVLTHHPEHATPADRVTFLNCGPAEAVRIGLAAADGKNLEVFSPTIGRQLFEVGLIDEIDLHSAPILVGEGLRLHDNPGSEPSASTGSAKATPPRSETCGTDQPQGRRSRPRPHPRRLVAEYLWPATKKPSQPKGGGTDVAQAGECRVPERYCLASGRRVSGP